MTGCSGAARLILLSLFVLAADSRREGNPLQDPQSERLRNQGFALLVSGRYPEAAKFYANRAREAEQEGDIASSALYWNNLGSSYLLYYQFTPALEAFVHSRELAIRSRSYEVQAGSTANISSLYMQNQDVESAGALIETVTPLLDRLSSEHNRASLELQLATVRIEQHRIAEGRLALARAIEHSQRAMIAALKNRNRAELSRAWAAMASAHHRLGLLALMESDWQEAELHFVEGFRIRTLFRLGERAYSCLYLGQLRQRRGDLKGALRLLNRAVELARVERQVTSVWKIRIGRGRLRAALGDNAGALEDYREALRIARRFRLGVLPADATRLLTDIRLDQAYDEFVESAARQSRAENRPDLAREALVALEENRAASLGALMGAKRHTSMPPGYGEVLARFQAAESRLVAADTPENRRQAHLLEAQVIEVEARNGYNRTAKTAGLLEQIQTRIPEDCVLFSFHLGKTEVHLWAVTRGRFRLYSFANADRIVEKIRKFSQTVRQEPGQGDETGRDLYQALFGGIGPEFSGKRRWLLALDESLFDVPFCALPVPDPGGGSRYLVERHSFQVIPGALSLAAPVDSGDPRGNGRFVGVGDAIYNSADPRWQRSGKPANLPRLVASGDEIEVCARAWGGPDAVLLKGAAATKARLERVLDMHPGVVHVAAHVVQAEIPEATGNRSAMTKGAGSGLTDRLRDRFIRLVLSPAASPGDEYLGPDEIRNWHLEGTLVTIDGCSSGGRAVPGAGLLGLTRPWLAAGARAVTVTRWPVADEEGIIWDSLYRRVKQASSDPAVALQMAQIDMIRSGGRHARPNYWAAYFLVGNRWPPDPAARPAIRN